MASSGVGQGGQPPAGLVQAGGTSPQEPGGLAGLGEHPGGPDRVDPARSARRRRGASRTRWSDHRRTRTRSIRADARPAPAAARRKRCQARTARSSNALARSGSPACQAASAASASRSPRPRSGAGGQRGRAFVGGRRGGVTTPVPGAVGRLVQLRGDRIVRSEHHRGQQPGAPVDVPRRRRAPWPAPSAQPASAVARTSHRAVDRRADQRMTERQRSAVDPPVRPAFSAASWRPGRARRARTQARRTTPGRR